MELRDRQKDLLKYIVDEYIATANPVGSKTIITKYMNNISAATIRNDMAYLEKIGLLEKNHTSSGRVPSTNGYKFYEKNFSNKEIDANLKLRLKKIFSDRHISINAIIEESIQIISEAMNLPVVILEKQTKTTLKRIDMVPINEKTSIIFLITSSGDLIKNLIELKDPNNVKDLSVCIRIFNDRLVDCPLDEIHERVDSIKELIKQKVIEYEFIMQEFVERIFNTKQKIHKNVYGSSSLLKLPEFQDPKKLEAVLSMLENTSVWELIAYKQQQSGSSTSIVFGDEVGQENLLFASTDIVLDEKNTTQLSMVGPTRIDYSKIKGLLEFIKNELEKNWK